MMRSGIALLGLLLGACATAPIPPPAPAPRPPAHLELSASPDSLRLDVVDGDSRERLAEAEVVQGVAVLPLTATLSSIPEDPLPLRISEGIVHGHIAAGSIEVGELPATITPSADGALGQLDGAWAAIAPHHWQHEDRHFIAAAPKEEHPQWAAVAAWAPRGSLIQLFDGPRFSASETELGWAISLPREATDERTQQLIASFYDPGLSAYRRWHRRLSALGPEDRVSALGESYDRYRQPPEGHPPAHLQQVFAYFCADIALSSHQQTTPNFASVEGIDALLALREAAPEILQTLEANLAFEGVPDLHDCFEAAGLHLAADTYLQHDEDALFRILGARFQSDAPPWEVIGGRLPWRRGDVLVAVRGTPIASRDDLLWSLRHIEARSRFPVLFRRGDRAAERTLTFPNLDTEGTAEAVRFYFTVIEGRSPRLPFDQNPAPSP